MAMYRLTLFRSSCHPHSQQMRRICHAICRKGNAAEEGLLPFDAEGVRAELMAGAASLREEGKLVPNPQGTDIHVREMIDLSRQNSESTCSASWLDLYVSWRNAPQIVLLCLGIALRHGLFLVDWQRDGRLWHPGHIVRTGEVRCRERAAALCPVLQRRIEGCRHIRKIEVRFGARQNAYPGAAVGYVIVLARRKQISLPPLEERVRAVCDILRSLLEPGEELCCRDGMFVVEARDYEISFTVEAYNKNPCLIGCMENGVPVVRGMGRMNTMCAMRQARNMTAYRVLDSALWRRMGCYDMVERYPNPADRFAASVRLERKLRRINLELACDVPDWNYGVVFQLRAIHSLESDGNDVEAESCLYLGEEGFSFLLPFILRHAPDSFDYYSTVNPLSFKVWKKISADMRHMARLILHDTFCEEVTRLIPNFFLSILQENEDCPDPLEKENPPAFLHRHRHRLYAFYQLVCDWIESRGEYGYNPLINISGL